jgi:sigma-B regulation protein RsbU (phosphoserine phosphatase)
LSASGPVRLLLVEDNPGDARLLRESLREVESLDFDLTHVGRLSEALRTLAADAVDLVLLDLSLPDAHGLETVSRVLAAAPEVPIVVLTGLADETVAVQAVQAGAQDYLVKGTVEGPTLARSIRYALERRRLLARERQARAAAEAAVRARDEVLRIVAHDIGNALSAVKIHATVLDRTLPEGDASREPRKRLAAIRGTVAQMDRLRQDLLDVAAIEAGRLSVETAPVALGAVVDEVVDGLAEPAAEKGLALEARIPDALPHARADRERIAQVLANLVGNAVKFTTAGEVVVSAEHRGAELHVCVADTGPGIPSAHLPHVFDRFWQAQSTRRAGAGLGLAIARGIVEAHEGAIWVESEVGRGTTFRFTLPVAA